MKANIQVIVTDMGNGGRSCGACGQDLDRGDPFEVMPKECPQCHAELVSCDDVFVNMGGSDF